RYITKANTLTDEQIREIKSVVDKQLTRKENVSTAIFNEWFRLPQSKNHPEIVDGLMNRVRKKDDIWARKVIATQVLTDPGFGTPVKLVEELIDEGRTSDEQLAIALSKKHWAGHPELLLRQANRSSVFMSRGTRNSIIARHVFENGNFLNLPE